MSGRHYSLSGTSDPLKLDKEYIRTLTLENEPLLDDLIKNPPTSDDFGNRYDGSRTQAILCFLNNHATERKLSLSFDQALEVVNATRGWIEPDKKGFWSSLFS